MRWAEEHWAGQGRIFSSSFPPSSSSSISSSSTNQQMLNLDDLRQFSQFGPIQPSSCTDDEMMWGGARSQKLDVQILMSQQSGQCFSQASRVGTKSVVVPHVLDIQVIPHQYWLKCVLFWFENIRQILVPGMPVKKESIAQKKANT